MYAQKCSKEISPQFNIFINPAQERQVKLHENVIIAALMDFESDREML